MPLPDEIRIFLEKHGALYHPARIELQQGELLRKYVLNVALAEAGGNNIQKEFYILRRLQNGFAKNYLPRVYQYGEVALDDAKRVRMFIGEWFDGYYEFHIATDPAGGKAKIAVWDTRKGSYCLDEELSADLYRQAACILTHYYNVETFEQIYPWHHAAGDFVIKPAVHGVDLRLISARNYAPLFDVSAGAEEMEASPVVLLNALLIFFLTLLIRMRLDRLNGSGEIVWAGEISVEGAVEGFFKGLAQKPHIKTLPGPIDESFRLFLERLTTAQLHELNTAIVDKGYHRQAAETAVIQQNIASHTACVWEKIKKDGIQYR